MLRPGLCESVVEQVKAYEDSIIAFLRDLIRIPSISGHEGDAMRRIAREMEALGFPDVRIDEIGNVVGRVGDGPLKILYDSHIDTVGVGDPGAWSFHPFEGKVENGVIYGRGASDNKAGIATMVYGAKVLMDLGLDDGFTLYVVGVPQEEDSDGWAVGEMISRGFIVPDFVVLGECTDLGINRGHRGRCELAVSTKGISCHASAPSRGVNAIYKMVTVIERIRGLESSTLCDPFLGPGTIAVTKMESVGGSLNAVPDLCTAYIDRRMTVGETAESCIRQVQEAVGPEAEVRLLRYKEKSWKGYEADMAKDYPTWVVPEDHVLVQAGVAAAEAILGRRPIVDKWMFSTDGVATMGMHSIPTIGFGPGEEKHTHTVLDQVKCRDLLTAAGFFAVFPATLAGMVRKGC